MSFSHWLECRVYSRRFQFFCKIQRFQRYNIIWKFSTLTGFSFFSVIRFSYLTNIICCSIEAWHYLITHHFQFSSHCLRVEYQALIEVFNFRTNFGRKHSRYSFFWIYFLFNSYTQSDQVVIMIKSVEKRTFIQTVVSQLNIIDINARVTFFRNHVFFRRIIIFFIDASANVEKIDFVWSISNNDQVKYWIKHKFVEIFKMLIFLRKQRDETIKLILNLQKNLNMKNKYEAAMKNNSCFVDEINYVKNQTNQQRKLLILKRTRSMQLQQRLNALKISNTEIEKVKHLQKNENKKSRFFSVFINSRRENQFFQFSTFINFFFIHDIVIITISDFVNDEKKFNKLFFSNKFIDKFDCELIFFDWLLKIQNCLFVNANHYSIDKHAVIFIINRTIENVVNHINVYRKKDFNYFISIEQIFIFFRNIYENRNEINNARKKYKTFKMRINQIFNEFFFHFRRFSNLLDFFFSFKSSIFKTKSFRVFVRFSSISNTFTFH